MTYSQQIAKNVDIISFFTNFIQLKKMKVNRNNIQGVCPIHSGADNPTAFVYFFDSAMYMCFTHHCERDVGRSLVGLISAVRQCTKQESVEMLEEFSGHDITIEDHENKGNYWATIWDNAWNSLYAESHAQKKISLDELKIKRWASIHHDHYLNEGFSSETLSEYQIGYSTDKLLTNRITIPVRNENDVLVMVSGRDPEFSNETKHDSPKFKHLANCDKSEILYNLNNVIKHDNDEIWIVEGFGCVWRAHEYGMDNVVAIMGTYISDVQIKLIVSHTTDVVIALDNPMIDEAGRIGAKYAIEQMKDYVNLYTINLGKYKDLGDIKTRDEFLKIIATKEKI